jgi:hypothetical protein
MRTYGEISVILHTFVTSALYEVRVQFHAPSAFGDWVGSGAGLHVRTLNGVHNNNVIPSSMIFTDLSNLMKILQLFRKL